MFDNFIVPKDLMPSDPRFGVGPSLIPVEYVKKLAETSTSLLGTSHRQKNVKNLVKDEQEGFKKYSKTNAWKYKSGIVNCFYRKTLSFYNVKE